MKSFYEDHTGCNLHLFSGSIGLKSSTA